MFENIFAKIERPNCILRGGNVKWNLMRIAYSTYEWITNLWAFVALSIEGSIKYAPLFEYKVHHTRSSRFVGTRFNQIV